MINYGFYVYLLWTNLPLLVIGYCFIYALINKDKTFLLTGLIGMLSYLLYIATLFLYIKDSTLKYFSYIIKIIGPIYIVYLMLGVKNKDNNQIIEAISILFIILFLGIGPHQFLALGSVFR